MWFVLWKHSPYIVRHQSWREKIKKVRMRDKAVTWSAFLWQSCLCFSIKTSLSVPVRHHTSTHMLIFVWGVEGNFFFIYINKMVNRIKGWKDDKKGQRLSADRRGSATWLCAGPYSPNWNKASFCLGCVHLWSNNMLNLLILALDRWVGNTENLKPKAYPFTNLPP